MKKLLSSTFLLSLLLIVSCKKSSINQDEASKSPTKINISQESLLKIKNVSINKLSASLDLGLNEQEAELSLQPLVASGNVLYSELMSQIQNSPEWNDLNYEEKFYISNFTNQQKAAISFLFNEASAAHQNPRWVNCAVSALGINSAISLFTTAFKVGMSATTAIQVLRFVGLKTLGYVALAVAVYEFTECVTTADESGTIGGPLPNTDQITNEGLLPTFGVYPSGTMFYYSYNKTHFRSGQTLPSISNDKISYDQLRWGPIYLDQNSLSKALPDGYYVASTDFNNNQYKYLEVRDGLLQNDWRLYNELNPNAEIAPIDWNIYNALGW